MNWNSLRPLYVYSCPKLHFSLVAREKHLKFWLIGLYWLLLQVNALADEVLKDLNPIRRKKCEHVIMKLVHERDVIRELIEVNVSSVEDFVWLAQMRFYLTDSRVSSFFSFQKWFSSVESASCLNSSGQVAYFCLDGYKWFKLSCYSIDGKCIFWIWIWISWSFGYISSYSIDSKMFFDFDSSLKQQDGRFVSCQFFKLCDLFVFSRARLFFGVTFLGSDRWLQEIHLVLLEQEKQKLSKLLDIN